MLYGFSADHSHPTGSRFQATVIDAGINHGTMTGFVLYPIDLIIVHDPLHRKTHRIPLNEYNHYDGNMIDFLTDVLSGRIDTP